VRDEEVKTMTRTRKALLATLPAAALVIGGVGVAAAAGAPPTRPVTRQEQVTVQQRQVPEYGSQLRLRDGSCDPGDQDRLQERDRLQDRDQVHDPIRDRLHDRLADR
jgi:hypothetical protein